MKNNKNIVFAGTPDFAAFHLQALIDNGLKPSLVLTQPDRKSGRGKKLTQSPVKKIALENNIEIFQPIKLDELAKQKLEEITPDLLIVVAYGLLLPQWTLDWAKFGAINVHGSLLPRWRGAAPIQRAIEAGDDKTGVSIMQMDLGLDTGDVWSETEIKITEQTTSELLHNEMQEVGANLLIETIPKIFLASKKPMPQSEIGETYAKKLTKQEAQINWNETAEIICRKIRAFNPVPVAHTQANTGVRFRIFSATKIDNHSDKSNGTVISEDKQGVIVKCEKGAILITEIQEIGKKRMLVKDYINGKSFVGLVFVD